MSAGRHSPFGMLVRTEARLLLREPIALLWGVAFPMALLAVMGLSSREPNRSLGGIRLVDAYEPILIAFSCATFALQGLPAVLAGYRERGMLRRLNATPVGTSRVLAAHLSVNLAVALVATAGIFVLGDIGFSVGLPGQGFGFVVTLMLVAAAMLGLGLLVASLAPNGRVAGAIGTMLFLPMMYFAGLWTPQAIMPPTLRRIGGYTPLGAAVQAIQHSMAGQWPSAQALGVLAGYAVCFGLLARRFFRWG